MADPLGFVEGVMARIDGPMRLRLVLQPLVVIFFAIRDGRRDAWEQKFPYLYALLTEPAGRRDMLRSGWESIGKVFIFAIVLDTVFQFLVFHVYRPLGALVVGIILAIVPYLALRGLVTRLIRRRSGQPDN